MQNLSLQEFAAVAQVVVDLVEEEDNEVFAINLLANELDTRPGRGHMRDGMVPRNQFLFRPAYETEHLVDSWMSHETKLFEYIGWYPGEVDQVLKLFEPALRLQGSANGGHFGED